MLSHAINYKIPAHIVLQITSLEVVYLSDV